MGHSYQVGAPQGQELGSLIKLGAPRVGWLLKQIRGKSLGSLVGELSGI